MLVYKTLSIGVVRMKTYLVLHERGSFRRTKDFLNKAYFGSNGSLFSFLKPTKGYADAHVTLSGLAKKYKHSENGCIGA